MTTVRRRTLLALLAAGSQARVDDQRLVPRGPVGAWTTGAVHTEFIGIGSGKVDYAGTPTHARTGVPALGRHPVVLYSPGFQTSRLVGTNHVEDLLSRGYVVVTMDHTGEGPGGVPGRAGRAGRRTGRCHREIPGGAGRGHKVRAGN